MNRTTIPLVVLALGVGTLGSLTGCSSSRSSDETAASSKTSARATYKLVSDAEVTAGLANVSQTMSTLEARRAANEADARSGLEAMYDKWFEVEGTVRAKEKDLYLQMEDGLVSVKIGVEENRLPKIASGLADFETARAAYLAKRS